MIEQEGRPEVCVNGVWGSICQYSWNEIDGYVFCGQLGYDGPSKILYTVHSLILSLIDTDTYYYSEFGGGDGPIIWSHVYCYGWEDTIFECSKDIYPDISCPGTGFVAGVSCREGICSCVLKCT